MRTVNMTIRNRLLISWFESYSHSFMVRRTTQTAVTPMKDKIPRNMPPLDEVQSAKSTLACLYPSMRCKFSIEP